TYGDTEGQDPLTIPSLLRDLSITRGEVDVKLSVIVPVYNERRTIERILGLVKSVPVDKEIIVVDDGSSDGTREILKKSFCDQTPFRVLLHQTNQGKGQAIRTGIAAAQGDAIIIQDADMEYDPMDYIPLLEAIQTHKVNVVYGSRFMNKHKVTYAWHRFVNWSLTAFTNVLYGSRLIDMETCYKLFRAETLRGFTLESKGFEIEVELTARTLKTRQRIVEVPISYSGRSFHEGKKIGWRDGVRALGSLIRYRFTR
ncbi:MAG: glycosyltransferase family 2 protein, partial [Candidatus Omnitrophota bacterium]